ncbi:transmembrane protein, putative (macronuclear) [Tetrahymena thermophila SB210]|uniref:Transmembrane protein, putative n=1 Tax=Tetrahymena thermophila (strain SB210) TaxID=312017 RepID=I7MFP8_TETTS|nr:transmembrane protein, putative [Tetrahymena thermophila SB210]EAS00413.1 transmembrane protein, putative [Tetrahymena thermophila SB210]|eukprot:XP_001020658.1 transmembrane protein, putative [Tetrahymena thermophila SB210]
MSKVYIAISFVVLALSFVQCTTIDRINLDKKTYNYLPQTSLQSQSSSNSNIYNCQAINEYFQTMGQNESLSLSYSVLKHNYLHITFDYAFINIQEVSGGAIKQGEVDISGTTYNFSTNVYSDNYKCMTRTDNTKVDGKSSASFVLAHSGQIDLKFYSNNLASFARFGVSNLTITATYCGTNAELSSKTFTCVCKSGYKETITQQGGLQFNECK